METMFLPLRLIALIRALRSLCLSFFPEDEMNEPFVNSTEMSKSPDRVKRFDTNDPYGSTVAPI